MTNLEIKNPDTSYMPATINPFYFEVFHFTCLKKCCFIASRVYMYVGTADKKSLMIHVLTPARALGGDFCFHFYYYHNLFTH